MKKLSLLIFILLFLLIFSGCSEPKKSITKVDDAKSAIIGAMTGTTGEQIVKNRFPAAQIKSFDDIMDAVVSLKSNQVDAVITAFPTAMNACKHNPELEYLSEPVAPENTSIAVSKGNTKLLNSINEVIKTLQKDGTLKDMRRRWFKKDLTPYEEIEINPPQKGEVLRIGTSATREPFCFVNAKGEISGHDGELSRRIGVMLGRPIQFVDMKFAALIPALKSNKIDIICTGMTATDERRKSVDFSESYFENAQVLLIKKNNVDNKVSEKKSLNLKSKDDLKDKSIAILLGSVFDTYALKEFPNATLLQYKSPSEILLAVKSGKADAAIYTHEALLEMLRDDKELKTFGDTLFTIPIGIGFNQNDDALRERFNLFLKKISADGTYDDMVKRWVTNGGTEMPVIQNSKLNGQLLIGTVGDKGLPFTVLKDGRMVGFDIELCERFAAELGKEVKWVDMEFGSLIISAATKKIDMIASTLMFTEERQKKVDFSDPYMRLGVSMFARKDNIAGYNSGNDNSGDKTFFGEIADSFKSNIIEENRYLLIIDGLKTTVIISIFATIFGTLFGAFICFMRMSGNQLLVLISKLYIGLLRGTPVLVLLLIIFYIVFASVDIDPVFVAVVAFGLNFAAYVAEMYRTGIESVDKGQSEAGIAMGFTRFRTFRFIVLPQALKNILPVYKGEVITLVKMTSIVGYIAVQDLTKASDIIRGRTFDAFFPLIMVAVFYFAISWILIWFLSYLERKTDPRLKKINQSERLLEKSSAVV